jgi:hypothetical protein
MPNTVDYDTPITVGRYSYSLMDLIHAIENRDDGLPIPVDKYYIVRAWFELTPRNRLDGLELVRTYNPD